MILYKFFYAISHWVEPFFLWYFTGINAIYSLFMIIGAFGIISRKKELAAEDLTPLLNSDSMPEITFAVPMFNESENAITSTYNLLNLSYRYKRIIIVNDGSKDNTFNILQKSFQLIPIPKYYEDLLPTQKTRAVYQSKSHPEIFVIDKEHGGKFDAANAAVNAIRTPYFIVIDADTFLDDAGFEALIRPILTLPKTIAIGASVRIVNGCSLDFHRIAIPRFPQNFLPAIQGLEYLRSFLLRQGLSSINGIFVVSGAFSVFPRDLIVQVGGFCDSVSEDMEIIIRLHRVMRENRLSYKIQYLPDPVAWTMGPTSLKDLGRQRTSWHFGSLESIWHHKRLFFNPFYGVFGLISVPFVILTEAIEPIIECIAWIYVILSWSVGVLNTPFFFLFMLVSFGYTFLYGIFCLVLEELSFRKYPSIKSLIILLLSNLVENFGYRQISVFWRLRGFSRFFKEFKRVQKESRRIQGLVKTAKVKNR